MVRRRAIEVARQRHRDTENSKIEITRIDRENRFLRLISFSASLCLSGNLAKSRTVRRFRDLLSPPLEIQSCYACRRRKVCSTKLRSGTKRCAADRQSEFCFRRCHKHLLALRLDTDHLVSDE